MLLSIQKSARTMAVLVVCALSSTVQAQIELKFESTATDSLQSVEKLVANRRLQPGEYLLYYASEEKHSTAPSLSKSGGVLRQLENPEFAATKKKLAAPKAKSIYMVRLSYQDKMNPVTLTTTTGGSWFIEPVAGLRIKELPKISGETPIGFIKGYRTVFHESEQMAKYRLVFDYGNGRAFSQRRRKAEWQDVPPNRIRLCVNDFLNVEIINSNAFRDSLSLHYEFKDINLENQADFIALFQGLQSSQQATENEESNQAVPVATPIENLKIEDSTLKGNDTLVFAAPLDELVTEALDKNPKLVELQDSRINYLSKFSFESFRGENKSNALRICWNDDLESAKAFDKAVGDFSNELVAQLNEKRKEIVIDIETLLASAQRIREDALLASSTPEVNALANRLREAFELNTELSKIARFSTERALSDQLKAFIDKLPVESYSAERKEEIRAMVAKYDAIVRELISIKANVILPIQIQDYDRMELNLKSGEKALTSSPYIFQIGGGFKIDFSTGIAISWLTDRQYYYSTVREVTVQQSSTETEEGTVIQEQVNRLGTISERRQSPDFGAAVLGHFYPRSGRKVNLGLCLGGLLNSSGFDLLTGGTLILGQRQRFVLSGGVALGEVVRLKPGYTANDNSEYSDTSAQINGDVPFTENRRAAAGFVAITWNLSNTVKKGAE